MNRPARAEMSLSVSKLILLLVRIKLAPFFVEKSITYISLPTSKSFILLHRYSMRLTAGLETGKLRGSNRSSILLIPLSETPRMFFGLTRGNRASILKRSLRNSGKSSLMPRLSLDSTRRLPSSALKPPSPASYRLLSSIPQVLLINFLSAALTAVAPASEK